MDFAVPKLVFRHLFAMLLRSTRQISPWFGISSFLPYPMRLGLRNAAWSGKAVQPLNRICFSGCAEEEMVLGLGFLAVGRGAVRSYYHCF